MDAPSTDVEPIDIADGDPASEALTTLSELLLQAQADVESVVRQLSRLPSSASSAASVLRELSTQIPVLGGEVDRLQLQVDAVQPASDATRTRRKGLTATAATLTEAVHELPGKLNDAVSTAADKAKGEGNALFKSGSYDKALELYSLAISIDRNNPVYRSNRSACYQAKGMWQEAANDARECIASDVNFVKGVLHLIKCQMRLGALEEAAKTLQSAPMGMVASSVELATLGQAVRDEVKAAGNASLKAGRHEQAIAHYTLAISLDGSQPVYYSNRSAAHQARRCWREGASDARQAIKLDKLFVKGYLHLGKCLMQMEQAEEAVSTCADGISALQEAGQPTASYAPLQDLLRQAQQQTRQRQAQQPAQQAGVGGDSSASASSASSSGGGGGGADSHETRAAALKEQGNALYKSGQYAEALRRYSQAIGTCPEQAGYYGNRAACWMMLSKYSRVVDDCSEALRRDGGLYKLRGRQSTALVHLGKLERAADVLREGVASGGEAATACGPQLQSVMKLQTSMKLGIAALEEGAYTKAKGCLAALVAGGVSQSTEVLMLCARCHLALKEHVDAAREAQKAIALDDDLLAAYVLRAEALHKMGQSDKAMKHLREALERDPDNQGAQATLRRIRRLVTDMASLRSRIEGAMSKRLFEDAAGLCGEALKIAEDDKTLCAPLLAERAKAYQRLARSRGRGETRQEREAAAAKQGGSGGGSKVPSSRRGDGADGEEAEDPRAGVSACWRRVLQDCGSAIYTDPTLESPYLLKAEALQAMERWAEAEQAIVALLNADPSKRSDQSILQKLMEAQFFVKRAARPDLYKLLGVSGVGSKASEKEIRQAYKKAALACHPDRFSDKSDAEKKEAEKKFKELGEALEVLTDDFKRKLWDEGHDQEAIAQQVQMRDQQRSQGR